MAVKENRAGTLLEVDEIFDAQRSSIYPNMEKLGGTYSLTMNTGTMAQGLVAGSDIFQFRNAHPNKFVMINRINLDGVGSIANFVAGRHTYDAAVVRLWTADGSGGTAANLAGVNNSLNNFIYPTSFLANAGSIRISSTAALTAGTRTVDTQALGAITSSSPASTAGYSPTKGGPLFIADINHPLILGQNEGFVVRATVTGTGTWVASITVRWTEVISEEYTY